MFFNKKVAKFVKTQFTENLLKVLRKHQGDPDNKNAIDYACSALGLNIDKVNLL
jgi:hypothetical protein